MGHAGKLRSTVAVAAVLAATLLFPAVAAAETTPTPPPIAVTMNWAGHGIPYNPATGVQGIGTVCVEMHLSTSRRSPYAAGAYQELAGLTRVLRYGDTYGNYGSEHYMTPQRSSGTWPGGAYGYMTPSQEQWYLNMRWEYVTWRQTSSGTRASNVDAASLRWHLKHRKVLVTNLATGRQAIGYMGDSGPGLGLGKPAGNRIAGLSPDLMYYLSGQDGQGKRTQFGADDKTEYRFEWVEDQNLPLGPLDDAALVTRTAPGSGSAAVPLASVLPSLEPWAGVPDARVAYYASPLPSTPLLGVPAPNPTGTAIVGGNAVMVVTEGVSPVTEWGPDTETELDVGKTLPLVRQEGDWYLVTLPSGQEGWLPSSAAVLVERPVP